MSLFTNFEQISNIILVFSLFTLDKYKPNQNLLSNFETIFSVDVHVFQEKWSSWQAADGAKSFLLPSKMMCEICSQLTIKILDQHQWCHSGVYIVLLIWDIFHTLFRCFYYWLHWTNKCWLGIKQNLICPL